MKRYISLPVNTGVPFLVYQYFIYIYMCVCVCARARYVHNISQHFYNKLYVAIFIGSNLNLPLK